MALSVRNVYALAENESDTLLMENDLDIRETPDGVVIAIKARAGGKKNCVNGLHAGALKVEVTVAPEKGKANKAIAKILAKFFGIAPSSAIIHSGDTDSQKRFLLAGVSLQDCERIIKSAGL